MPAEDAAPLVRFGLLLVRPGMVVMVAPLLGGASTPGRVKVAFIVLLALLLAPVVGVREAITGPSLALVVAREVAIGLALALVVSALVAGAEFAGHLIGHQIGFTYGATVDPASGVRNTVVATLYGMVATLTLLGTNAHHQLLRTLADSYQVLPMGSGGVNAAIVEGVGGTLALVLTTGVRLAAPILVVLLLVEVAMAVIARSAPALNQMIVGHGARVLIGLLVLAAMVGTVPRVMPGLMDAALGIGTRLAGAFR
ncbi:MAG: flagellar biosynthetic protein FliR [Vicinamibacterales bacterium]